VDFGFGVANTLVALSLLAISHAQTGSDLDKQMEVLHVHTALLIRSQEMDDLPAWSPDGRFLAANLAGKWVKIDVSAVQLQEAKWHEQRVGVQTKADLQPLTDDEVHAWAKAKEFQKRRRDVVTTASGLKVEMRHNELSAALVISKGKRQSVIWESGLENCYGLTLSPNKAHVAYLCETNGILVMDPEKAFEMTQRHQ
jgi:hypothetical protein